MRPGRRATASVFIVEDNADTRAGPRDALETEGFEVFATGNGQDALDRLRSAPKPDALLLDLYMPGLNGFEIYRVLRNDPNLATIPVTEEGLRAKRLEAPGLVRLGPYQTRDVRDEHRGRRKIKRNNRPPRSVGGNGVHAPLLTIVRDQQIADSDVHRPSPGSRPNGAPTSPSPGEGAVRFYPTKFYSRVPAAPPNV
jgi:CheY-like chemotaxis protein